ncbi:MAG: hypothetical protein SWY16_02910 [Cyanobacteriota bacterium]|nr:hypothetical protein [Cyanobacteriota bacterium]
MNVTPIAHRAFISIAFIVLATILSIGFGQWVKTGTLPFKAMMGFSPNQWQFMRVWVNVALAIGAIVPLVMLVVLWDRPIVRHFLASYLVVLVVQLASEVSLSRWFVKSVFVPIGTLYTGFRVWQLWEGLHLTVYPQPWFGLLWLMLVFWAANLIMLLLMAIPSIWPESNERSA